MNEPSTDNSADRDASYQVAGEHATSVVVEREPGSEPERFPASLLELSRTGTKLSISSYIPFGSAVRLNLAIEDLDLDLSVLAEVCWILPSRGSQWLLGCSFNPELPEATLAALASGGRLERRDETRHLVNLPAIANWELGDTNTPVTVHDYSRGGVCLLTDHPGKVGHRLLLQFDKGDGNYASVLAKAQWAAKVDAGHLVGCAFLNAQDFHCVRDIALSLAETPETKSTRPSATPLAPRRRRWLWVGLLGLLLIMGIWATRANAPSGEAPREAISPLGDQNPEPVRHAGADRDHATEGDLTSAEAYTTRAVAQLEEGGYAQALADLNRAIALDPTDALAYERRAWLWATCPDARYRDGKGAVNSALRACLLNGWDDWNFTRTLAAAYAESGDFEKAVQWQMKIFALAPDDEKKLCRRQLALYSARSAYRTPTNK